ncbi:fimbrial protein [Pseudomonas sp. Fl4BN1]|nr:fimbrial protein [Pseudomonas sp. Fl4BN1]
MAVPTAGGGGVVNFTGSVKADTCYPVNGTTDVSVPLGEVQARELGTVAAPVGGTGASTPLTIKCASGTKVQMSFKPAAADKVESGKALRVNEGVTGAGFAKNVAIVMLKADGSVMNLDTEFYEASFGNGSTGGTINIPLKAAYVISTGSTSTDVTAGTANAKMPFVLSYE